MKKVQVQCDPVTQRYQLMFDGSSLLLIADVKVGLYVNTRLYNSHLLICTWKMFHKAGTEKKAR